MLRRERRQGNTVFIFLVQLNMSRIGSRTRLIHTLVICVTSDYTYPNIAPGVCRDVGDVIEKLCWTILRCLETRRIKKGSTYEYSYSHTPGMKKSCCSSRKYLPRNGSPDMHPFVSCSMVRSFSLPSPGFRCNAHTKFWALSFVPKHPRGVANMLFRVIL